jgi:hypothetical protein
VIATVDCRLDHHGIGGRGLGAIVGGRIRSGAQNGQNILVDRPGQVTEDYQDAFARIEQEVDAGNTDLRALGAG